MSSPRFLDAIDQVTALGLFLIFLAVTAVPALIYVEMSAPKSDNGLVSDRLPITIGDALYFSFVTETTVGYGDIKPLGFSRVLACFQILAGYLIGGVTVAKLVTLKGQDIRRAGRSAKGTWLVLNEVPGMETIISVTEIDFDGKTIAYGGSNYSIDGDFLGLFTSDYFEVNGHQIKFRYSNGDSVTDYFSQGISTLHFREKKDGTWGSYNASARDASKARPITFEGWRANPDEIDGLSESPEKRVEVVVAFGKKQKIRKMRQAGPWSGASQNGPVTS